MKHSHVHPTIVSRKYIHIRSCSIMFVDILWSWTECTPTVRGLTQSGFKGSQKLRGSMQCPPSLRVVPCKGPIFTVFYSLFQYSILPSLTCSCLGTCREPMNQTSPWECATSQDGSLPPQYSGVFSKCVTWTIDLLTACGCRMMTEGHE